MALRGILAGLLVAASLAGCRSPVEKPSEPVADPESTLRQVDSALALGELELASQLIEKGLEAARREGSEDLIWRFRLASSERLLRGREFERALEALQGEVPADLDPPSLPSRIWFNRARAATQLGLYADAVENLDRADSLVTPDDPGLPIEILGRRGFVAYRKGDDATARKLLERSYQLADASGMARLKIEAAGNLGYFLERQYAFDLAIGYYERVLDTAVQAKDQLSVIKARTNLGWCHNHLGDFDRALELMLGAADLAMETRSRELDNVLMGIGGVYHNLGDFENAVAYYRRALEVASDSTLKATAFNNLADCYIELGEWDLAADFNRLSVANRSPKDAVGLAYSEVTAAKILIGQGRHEEAHERLRSLADRTAGFVDRAPLLATYSTWGGLFADQGDLEQAERLYRLALGSVEKVRQKLSREQWQISFHSLWNHFTKSYVELLVERGQSDRALERVEANRALVLSGKLGLDAGDGANSAANLRRTARQLNATLLSFWLAPKRSFLWAVTGDGIRRIDLPPAQEIEALVEGHKNRVLGSLSAHRQDPYAVGLYETLLSGAADMLKPGSRVVVVPDGRLHELNFETLQTPGERSGFLIQDVTLAVAPSLPLLQAHPTERTPSKDLLLVGNPVAVEESFPALPEAESEIKAVLGNFSPERVTSIVREHATPQGFLEASPGDFAMLHFTAHAVANKIDPLNSAVILSPRDGAHRLFARDLGQIRLKAAVVTLSACRSAGAKAYSGEGLVGFAWAFLEAGAHNVVAGLWEVDDRASADLMSVYYRQLALGRSPAEALREAKLELMARGPAYRDPYYWAPFQIYTRTNPFGAAPATLAFRR